MTQDLLDPKIDIVFKMLFSDEDSESMLVRLLNCVVCHEPPIVSAKVLNPKIPLQAHDDKGTILDILAELDDGRLVNVEMQMANRRDTRARALYHWARIFSGQLRRGRRYAYSGLKTSYAIFFLNYLEFREMKEALLLHTLHITHAHQAHLILPYLKLHFIELPQLFNSNWHGITEQKGLAMWSKFLLNPTDKTLQEALMSDPELAKAKEKLKKISASEEKRQLARMREKALLDWNSLQVDAREEGRQEGLAEGQQLGIEQGKQLGIEQGKQLGIEQGKQLGIEQGKQLGIEQGKQLGVEQGRHEGIREAQIQFLRHLLVSRRYSVQELYDLTQAPLEKDR